ncbi:hypothetical protein CHARACLAT_008365 [Characodon lateralis]|uniref:Uncharacterized protein n=1 Tax=Characodon lateralis TaxID=208331 RepID=A0ABU7CWJ4_9TELE|nr:hypothetical protein [Characodon lateralis]
MSNLFLTHICTVEIWRLGLKAGFERKREETDEISQCDKTFEIKCDFSGSFSPKGYFRNALWKVLQGQSTVIKSHFAFQIISYSDPYTLRICSCVGKSTN